MRPGNRAAESLRSVTLTPHVSGHAEGSCMAEFGRTRVLCTASVETSVPPFLRNSGKGWITAEYGMLPRATHTRSPREAARGKQGGRTLEIQRLIGRSLRAVANLEMLGERQITVDCDVIEADGGTRTAAITGGYVAVHLACQRLINERMLSAMPLVDQVAAISCGIVKNVPVLDLEYEEDSTAEVDANFVMTGRGALVEVQATGEGRSFSEEEMQKLLILARGGIGQLLKLQKQAISP